MDLVPIVKFDDIVTESGREAGEVVLAVGMIGDGVGAIGWVTMQTESRKMRRRIIKMSMQKRKLCTKMLVAIMGRLQNSGRSSQTWS